MAYIGASPPATALTASDIADGIISADKLATNSVSEVKMADDAISLAELKAGTDGELITWDASGNPAAVAAGTSGHFLKSQGAGSVPVFASASATWTKIKTITINSSTSAVTFTHGTSDVIFDSTYKFYKVFISGLNGNSSTDFTARARIVDGDTDGTGTSIDTGANYKYAFQWANSNNAHSSGYHNGVSNVAICADTGLDNTAGIGLNIEMTFQNTEGDATYGDKMVHYTGVQVGTDDYAYCIQGIFSWQVPANKIRGVSFFPSGDNFKYGEFVLYGIK